jgi:hypothetical protein
MAMLIITVGIDRDCSFPAPDAVLFLTTVLISEVTEEAFAEAEDVVNNSWS